MLLKREALYYLKVLCNEEYFVTVIKMNDDDLVVMEQNAYRDTMEDGITETLAGMFFLFTTLMFRIPAFIGVFVLFYIFLMPLFIERIRERYTYPRLGYVKLRTNESDWDFRSFGLLIASILVATAIAVQMLTNDLLNLYNWVLIFPFTFGMLMFGPSTYLVAKTGSKKYWLFGIFTTIVGLSTAILSVIYHPGDYYVGILYYCLFLGLIFGIGGLIKFLHFTRAYPVLEPQGDEMNEQI